MPDNLNGVEKPSEFNKPGFGRVYKPDDRDRRYPMRLALGPLRDNFFPAGLPAGTRHYRSGIIYDQGSTGTCVGHGWRGWLNNAPLMTKSGPTPFELYRKFVAIDEFPENDSEATAPDASLQSGTSVRAGAEWLRGQGHIKNYLWAESWEDVRSWHLAGFGTCVLGIWWREGMLDTDKAGFIHYVNGGGYVGGHCVVTTGWNDERNAVRIQNSWGYNWGDGGRCWLSAEDLQRSLEDEGEACAAIESKAVWP